MKHKQASGSNGSYCPECYRQIRPIANKAGEYGFKGYEMKTGKTWAPIKDDCEGKKAPTPPPPEPEASPRVGAPKPKPGDFHVAGRGNTTERRSGYILGDLATHKEPGKKVYFWTVTHLPTGVDINAYPGADTKAKALRQLQDLDADGLPPQKLDLLKGFPRIERLK